MAIKILSELGLPDAELSILFVSDHQIQKLNKYYLRRDKPTNVLAFPMQKGEFSCLNPHILGDIVISVETARRQSNRFGLNPMEMIILLLIHGILHLVGYEHEESKTEARKMALKQKELFKLVIEKD